MLQCGSDFLIYAYLNRPPFFLTYLNYNFVVKNVKRCSVPVLVLVFGPHTGAIYS
jgi:hypothetical protein